MKFLVDAQLPRRLCIWLGACGHDARHTLDLPAANRTSDADIVSIAQREDRVVVSKDDDFVRSRLVHGKPDHLLLVATGNIANAELLRLFQTNLVAIVDALEDCGFVEMGRDKLIRHR